jgi:hypothetical protein
MVTRMALPIELTWHNFLYYILLLYVLILLLCVLILLPESREASKFCVGARPPDRVCADYRGAPACLPILCLGRLSN